MKKPLIPLFFALTACGSGELQFSDMAPAESYSAAEPGPAAMRRLTHAQYTHALQDLFGQDLVIPPIVEPDLIDGGLASVGASSASYSPRGVESMESSAFAIAEQVDVQNLPGNAGTCELADAACMREVIAQWGRLIWRRALTEEEATRILGIAEATTAALGDPQQGITYALAALLQSPNFLYRIELGQDGQLTDLELATRLSFFLWNTTPDDALLKAAESGELSSREGLFATAQRMMDDERLRRGLRELFTESFHLEELDHLRKDPTLFENFDSELGAAAREETLRLLEYAALDAEWDYRDIMTTRESFINPRLAALYGVPAPSLTSFAPVTFGEQTTRAGLLGHASFLNLHSHSVASSATLRGEAVRVLLLCQSIPAPPVDVDTSIPEPSGTTRTLRERVAEHLENPSCSGCHMLTDPIGLGLENYDAIGRWRERDNGANIDPSGELDGTAFEGPLDLGAAIGEHGAFTSCLVRTMSRYATGRVENTSERTWLDTMNERFTHHGYRVRPLMMEMVMSPLFRRVGAPSDELPTEEE